MGSLADLLDPEGAAAFLVDGEGRIAYWNAGAERLLGRSQAEVMGLPCHLAVRGRDPFGNRYCAEACPLWAIRKAGERIHSFQLHFEVGAPVAVTILPLAGGELLHVLEPPPWTDPPLPGSQLLTEREQEVLRLMAKGLTDKEIGKLLGISPATARNHVRDVLHRLGAHTKAGAVALGYEMGLVEGA